MESLYYFAGPAYLLIPNLLNKQLKETAELNKKINRTLRNPLNTIKHLTAIARLGEPGQERAFTKMHVQNHDGSIELVTVNNKARHLRAIIERGNISRV